MNGHRWPEDKWDIAGLKVEINKLNTENQKLRELVKEMGEILVEVDLTPAYDARGECCFCGKLSGHNEDCERKVSQEILSRPLVKKIMGEGK